MTMQATQVWRFFFSCDRCKAESPPIESAMEIDVKQPVGWSYFGFGQKTQMHVCPACVNDPLPDFNGSIATGIDAVKALKKLAEQHADRN